MTEALLLLIVLLLVGLAALVWRTRGPERDSVQAALSRTWIDLGLSERIEAVEEQARQMASSYRAFESMLRVPTERASFGEALLETILKDQLPPDIYYVRQRVLDGKIPDAALRSTAGLICIDCKFPLENYQRMVEAREAHGSGCAESVPFKRAFLRNVRGHLDKIAQDYVCPDKGSAEFAFAYIPSESVYYFLCHEAYDLLRTYARSGVQVVSPLTLSHKLELIKAGVHARRLSVNARQVRDQMLALGDRFTAVDEAWRVLYGTHLHNMALKAEELDRAYGQVRQEFERITRWHGVTGEEGAP